MDTLRETRQPVTSRHDAIAEIVRIVRTKSISPQSVTGAICAMRALGVPKNQWISVLHLLNFCDANGYRRGRVTPLWVNELKESNKELLSVDWSVRARKMFSRLGLRTFGDLASKTAYELSATRDFGQTTLAEVVQNLQIAGLSLRNDDED